MIMQPEPSQNPPTLLGPTSNVTPGTGATGDPVNPPAARDPRVDPGGVIGPGGASGGGCPG